MRIAIASEGRELTSRIDSRLGRAKYIIIYDTRNGDVKVLDNQEASQMTSGAGVNTAEAIVEMNVDYVVSQNFGPKALQVFKAAGVKAAVISEVTVAEAVDLVKLGRFYMV